MEYSFMFPTKMVEIKKTTFQSTGDYKLIKFQDDKSVLLFNLLKDKKEEFNLANQNPEKVKKLVKTLDNYLIEVKAPKWQDGITWKNKSLKEINSNYQSFLNPKCKYYT